MAPKFQLAGYTLGDALGEGTQGTVKEAVHDKTRMPVAIKYTSSYKDGLDKDGREWMKQCIYQEVFVANHLRHPNIVTCYDAKVVDDKMGYIVMERMSGHLESHIEANGGKLTEKKARRYFRQLIHGVDYCHSLFLIHRDIKPRNLLLDGKKRHLKIADFGLSKFLPTDLHVGTYCGPPMSYRAPEIRRPIVTIRDEKGQFLDKKVKTPIKYSGPQVDIFSCGATLCKMITGSPPIFTRHQLVIPEAISPDAADLIQHMTAYDPNDRITIEGIKKHKWFTKGSSRFLCEPQIYEEKLDNEVLIEAVNLVGGNREDLIKGLIEGAQREDTVAYKLLLRKRQLDL